MPRAQDAAKYQRLGWLHLARWQRTALCAPHDLVNIAVNITVDAVGATRRHRAAQQRGYDQIPVPTLNVGSHKSVASVVLGNTVLMNIPCCQGRLKFNSDQVVKRPQTRMGA